MSQAGTEKDCCPMCFSSSMGPRIERPAARLNGYSLRKCRDCESVTAWPRTAAGAEHYHHEMPVLRWEFSEVADSLKKDGVKDGVLDVGCGDGSFVQVLKDNGIAGIGLDFNADNVEVARKRGLDCRCVDLRDLPRDDRFSALTAFHVIEHLEEPKALLMSMKDLLADGGAIYLSFPNVKRAALRYLRDEADYPPNHLNRISSEGMKHLAQSAGLEVVSFSCEPRDVDLKKATSLAVNRVLEAVGLRNWVKAGGLRNYAIKAVVSGLVQPFVMWMVMRHGSEPGYTSLYKLERIAG